jgi:hypothetical protein
MRARERRPANTHDFVSELEVVQMLIASQISNAKQNGH